MADREGRTTTNGYFYFKFEDCDYDSDRGQYEREVYENTLESTDNTIAEVVDSGLLKVSGVAGQSLSTFNICYLKSDGKYYKASATSSSYVPGLVIASETLSTNGSGTFYRRGLITNTSWSWATAGLVYTSRTTGLMTQTLATTSGSQVQIIGIAKSKTILDFDPQLVIVQVS